MTREELKIMQSLPLEIKILKSLSRIREFINQYGMDGVYISFSGGKDSTVLCDMANKEFPGIKMIFVSTGVELPGTIKFVLKKRKEGWNIEIIKPKKTFRKIIEDDGYPVVSKEQSQYIREARTTKSEKLLNTRLNGNKSGRGKVSEKWKYLIEADFKISDRCCYYLKKEPVKRIEKERGIHPIVGTMADESSLRMSSYLKTGCNSFDGKRPISKPLSFWTEKDIWEYIKVNELEISEEYTKNGRKRTGCYGCLFGCHLEERETGTNRILELKKIYPKLFKHLMEDLNYKHVMETLGLKTEEMEQLNLSEGVSCDE